MNVSISISTKSTVAPQKIAAFVVATNVFGLVQTESPGLSPSDIYAMCNADVALLLATPNLAPTLLATDSSNFGTVGP